MTNTYHFLRNISFQFILFLWRTCSSKVLSRKNLLGQVWATGRGVGQEILPLRGITFSNNILCTISIPLLDVLQVILSYWKQILMWTVVVWTFGEWRLVFHKKITAIKNSVNLYIPLNETGVLREKLCYSTFWGFSSSADKIFAAIGNFLSASWILW